MKYHPRSPSPDDQAVATFSVVVETENLAVEGPEALQRCLDSLMEGPVDLSRAREVVVTNSGDLNADWEARVRSRFPFLRVLPLPADTGYYEAKMLGADATSGQVVVFCDSDLIVEPGWLDAMLRPFGDRPDIGLVAGETSLAVTGPYTLAMLLAFFFPPFSNTAGVLPARGYAANNVAIRRPVLHAHPIPTGLGAYRGNCQLHAARLKEAGVTLWRQPEARAIHPVLPPARFLQRFFISGQQVLQVFRRGAAGRGRLGGLRRAAVLAAKQLARPVVRLPRALGSHPRRWLMLPVALPVVLAAELAYVSGVVLGLVYTSMSFTAWALRMEREGR